MKIKAVKILAIVLGLLSAFALISGVAALSKGGNGGHDCVYNTISNTATCTAPGEKQEACGICKSVRVLPSPALGHALSITDISATCTTDGTYEEICTRCDHNVSELRPAFGHDYVDGVCSRCGEGRPDTEQYTLSGTWVFNEDITFLTQHAEEIHFSSNGVHYENIHIESIWGCSALDYDNTLANNGDWTNEAHRTIIFDGTQTASKEFYDWFTANAVEQITDLTGTTWLLNETLSLDALRPEYVGDNEVYPYKIDFTSPSGSFIGIGFATPNENTFDILLYEREIEFGVTVWMAGWYDDNYRQISITGGRDATDSDLIAWLQANATLVEEPEQYTLSGTWLFNDTITIPNGQNLNVEGPQTVAEVEFTSAGRQYSSFCVGTSNNTSWNMLVYESETYGTVVAYMGGWIDQAYRTITFDGTQTVSKEFYDWFTANAVEQITDLTGTTWKLNDTVSNTIHLTTFDVLGTAHFLDSSYDGEFTYIMFNDRGNIVHEYDNENTIILGMDNAGFFGILLSYSEHGRPIYAGYAEDTKNSGFATSLVKTEAFSPTAIDTITITGGTDVTNPELIAFLMANATPVN